MVSARCETKSKDDPKKIVNIPMVMPLITLPG